MLDLMQALPGKKRPSSKGWYSFNAPCCHNRGHRPDKRSRGGVLITDHEQIYHCFNCNFKCRYTIGEPLTYHTKQLLKWCGYSEEQVSKFNLDSIRHGSIYGLVAKPKSVPFRPNFKKADLPKGAVKLEVHNPTHQKYKDYLISRDISPSEYDFYVTPDSPGRNSERIIIPCTFKNENIGYVSRYLDGKLPKYVKEQPPGYLFGYDFQQKNWEVCILTEGHFDAILLKGCALGHDTISDEQVALLQKLHKKIIMVPDQDETGLTICDRIIELGFSISLPDWGTGVKDINDAVLKYGRLPTLLSILQNATTNKIKVDMGKRAIAKRL